MNICPNCHYRSEEKNCPRDGFPMVDEAGLTARPTEPNLIGKVFENRYEVTGLLGRGGMAWVFRARHMAMGHDVALKVMRRELAEDVNAVKRFFQEARACSRLRHPHTIRVHDFGRSDDKHLFLAMEFLEGQALSQAIRNEGALAPERAAHIGRQICQSLDEAHESGMVHRDLKPENIFLCRYHRTNDFVKVLDFGIAKFVGDENPTEALTRSGMVLGTPKYFSPEQAQGRPLDRRSDLYSLGVVLYEMLVGKAPFQAASTAALLLKHITEPAPRVPAVVDGRPIPAELCELVRSLLEKDPGLRPNTAAEVEERLAPFADRRTTGETPVAPALGAAGGGRAAGATFESAGTGTRRRGEPQDEGAPPTEREVPLHIQATLAARGTAQLADLLPAASGSQAVGRAPAGRRRVLVALALALAVMAAVVTVLLLRGPTAAPAGTNGVPHPEYARPDTSPGAARAADAAPAPPVALTEPAKSADTAGSLPAAQAEPLVVGTGAPAGVASQSAAKAALDAAAGAGSAPQVGPASPVPAAAPASVVLRSVPPGATVREGSNVLGRTPLTVTVDAAVPRMVRLSLVGFQPVEHELRAADGPERTVVLAAKKRPAPATNSRQAGPASAVAPAPERTPPAGPAATRPPPTPSDRVYGL